MFFTRMATWCKYTLWILEPTVLENTFKNSQTPILASDFRTFQT